MSKLEWDKTGEKRFEMGVDHGVLYTWNSTTKKYNTGVVWNGLTTVTASPDGAEPTDLWADNIKYATLRSAETFGATIEAYTYPDEFGVCDGSAEPVNGVHLGQQSRQAFGFCYRTKVGDDTDPEGTKYRIHIIYNATERSYETINDSPDAQTLSWEITTTPVTVAGFKAVSEITVDSWDVSAETLTALENKLYGTNADATNNVEASDPTLPQPDELLTLLGYVAPQG